MANVDCNVTGHWLVTNSLILINFELYVEDCGLQCSTYGRGVKFQHFFFNLYVEDVNYSVTKHVIFFLVVCGRFWIEIYARRVKFTADFMNSNVTKHQYLWVCDTSSFQAVSNDTRKSKIFNILSLCSSFCGHSACGFCGL